MRGQSPDTPVQPQPTSFSQQTPPVAAGSPNATQLALQSSVRLRVEESNGYSVGTGTIIDVHGNEALVLTCGHLFRSTQGRGNIAVELFVPGAQGPIPGRLLAYDADVRDIGLLVIQPPVAVRAAKVATPADLIRVADQVFSVGCDLGQDPTVRPSRITAIDRYAGRPNFEIDDLQSTDAVVADCLRPTEN